MNFKKNTTWVNGIKYHMEKRQNGLTLCPTSDCFMKKINHMNITSTSIVQTHKRTSEPIPLDDHGLSVHEQYTLFQVNN